MIIGKNDMNLEKSLQQTLLEAVIENKKQIGIIEETKRTLAKMKLDQIKKRYEKTYVHHEKYGPCTCRFTTEILNDGFRIYLKYYVDEIPLDGLSVHDKKIARRYNSYHPNDIANTFNTFEDAYNLSGYCYWDYTLDKILNDRFLSRGIVIDGDNKKGSFFIILKED